MTEFAAGQWDPGIHIIHLPTGGHLDLYVGGDPCDGAHRVALPVFFSGAVSGRAGRPGPFLSGLRMGPQLGTSFIALADPTLHLDPELTIGWYTGRPGEGLQDLVTQVLETIGARSGRELLLIGGSGGGFAALNFAGAVATPASAMIWNPQTDVLDYQPRFVVNWLSAILGMSRAQVLRMDRAQRETHLARGGIAHRLTLSPPDHNPRRLVYLQNDTDSHVEVHCQPWLARSNFAAHGGGEYSLSSDRIVWVGPISPGHQPPPAEVIRRAVVKMLSPARRSVDVLHAVRRAVDEHIEGAAAHPAPRCFVPEPGCLVVDARALSARSFTFRLRRDGQRYDTTSWTSQPQHSFSFAEIGEYHVEVGARRGTDTIETHVSNHVSVSSPVAPLLAATESRHEKGDDVHPADDDQMTRTFIYGSCVSRDTFEFLRPHGYSLTTYVARQSLLSAYSRVDVDRMPTIRTSSPFQRRMIEGDWSSSLPRALARVRGKVDLLLWDLCDERLGVRRLPTGHYVTRSVDTLTSGLDDQLREQGAEIVPFGSDVHRRHFRARLDKFRQRLDNLKLLDRTLVIAPAWASLQDDGELTPASFGITATQANPIFDDYHQAIADVLDVPVIRLPPEEVLADARHQWGTAPFHYTTAVYEELVARVRDHVVKHT